MTIRNAVKNGLASKLDMLYWDYMKQVLAMRRKQKNYILAKETLRQMRSWQCEYDIPVATNGNWINEI